MSTKKTQGKKLQGGGQLLEKLQNFNPPADNKNTIPVTEKLPIVSSNLISNYAPRENDPFSRFSLDKMKDNPDYTPGMNDRRGDPIQVGMEQYTPTYSLEEVDFEYTPPLIPITPDEMITPPVWAPDTIILNKPNTTFLAGGSGRSDFNPAATIAKRKGVEAGRSGRVILEDGTKVDFSDPESGYRFDNANWFERIWGEDNDGKLFKRTYGYEDFIRESVFGDRQSPELIKFLENNEEYKGQLQRIENRAQESKENMFRPFKGMDISSYFFKEKGYYPVYDEDEQQWYLQESSLSEEEFMNLRGALLSPYGVGQVQKGTLHSFVDGFSEGLGSTWESLVNFGEIVGDAFDGVDSDLNPDGFTDRLAASARTAYNFNKYAKTAMQQTDSLFSSGDSFGNGLGSGLASLLSFWGLGGVGAAGVKGAVKLVTKKMLTKFPRRAVSMIGHMSGGMPLNAGEVYSMAKMDGLDDDDAAGLALTVGFINTLVEYGVGTNALANRAFGTYGTRAMTKAILDFGKRGGMKMNTKQTLDQATPYILQKINKFLQKGDDFLNSPFRYLESVGVKSAGKYGTNLLTRTARATGSGLEEGSEEFIQGAIIDGATKTYNNLIAGEDGKRPGMGMFNTTPFDANKLLEEAAIGFILGGSTRFISNARGEADLMRMIAEGNGQELLNQIDHLGGMNLLGKYQTKKLKKRIGDLINVWNANGVGYSHLSIEDQGLVGQFLLSEQENNKQIESLNRRISKINANPDLSSKEKNKKTRQLKIELNARKEQKKVLENFLDIYSDPKKVDETKINKMPSTVRNAIFHLSREKSLHQSRIEYLRDLLVNDTPANRRRARNVLKKILGDTELKRTLGALTAAQKQQVEDEIKKYEKYIEQLDEQMDTYFTDSSTWDGIVEKVNNEMKTTEEKRAEEEKPLTTNPKEQPKKNETIKEKRKREAKEEAERIEKQVGLESQAISNVIVPSAKVKMIEDKDGNLHQVASVEKDINNKVVYVSETLDNLGNNIKVPEEEVILKVTDFGREKHRDNFLKTYWLHAVGLNDEQRDQLEALILKDKDLINRIQIQFVYKKRELSDSAIKEENMDINMNGSYLKIVDTSDNTVIAVIRTPSRFYDKSGKLIPGDKMTRQFFSDNFDKNTPFTKQEWKEFGMHYTKLVQLIEYLEGEYKNATEENPIILDESQFDISFEVGLVSNKTKKRLLITDLLVGDHTFDGDYRIYDRQEQKAIIGKEFTKDELSRLPSFDGRYFALVKRGNTTKWVRVNPRQLASADIKERLKRAKAAIEKANKIKKEGSEEVNLKDYIESINKDLDLFIAAEKDIGVHVIADYNRKTDKYELKLEITQRRNGEYHKLYKRTQRPDVSLDNIISTVNNVMKKYGLSTIGVNSFKQSIPLPGKDVVVDPSSFETTLEPSSSNFDNPTMIITPKNEFFETPVKGKPVTPTQKTKPKKKKTTVREEVKLEDKPDTNKKISAEDLLDDLSQDGGDLMSSLPEGRLNNEVRKDIIKQIVAKYIYGSNNYSETLAVLDIDKPMEDALIEKILDAYIAGLTPQSFMDGSKEYTAEEAADIKSKFRQAFLTKLKLETNQEIKDDIINEVKRQVVFLATDFDILDEGRTDFNISFTELGGVKSLSSRIKQFISLLTSEAKDNFGRTKWQSKQYGTETIRKTLNGHNLASHLVKALANDGSLVNLQRRLEALAKYDEQAALVLSALNDPAHKHVKTAFESNFNKEPMKFLKLVGDNKGRFIFIDPLEHDGANQVFRMWKSKNTKDKKAIDNIANLIESVESDPTSAQIDKLIKEFDKLGWQLTKGAAAYILGDEQVVSAFTELQTNELISNPKKFFRGYISDFNKKNKTKTNMFKLARIAAMFDPTVYEPNYIDADGNAHYKYTQRNYYIEATNSLKKGNKSFIKAGNYNLLIKKGALSTLDLQYVGDVVINKKGKVNKNLVERERLLLHFALFQKRDIPGTAYYIPHVIADKKSMFGIRMPVIDTYYNEGVTQEAIDDVYNSIFVREVNRNATGELLISKNNKVNYFGVLQQLNDVEYEGQLLPDFLRGRKNNLDGLAADIKQKVIKPMLEQVVADTNERIDNLNIREQLRDLRLDSPLQGTINNKVGRFAINHFIMSVSWTQLMHGDANFIDDRDMNKRMAGPNAAGDVMGQSDYNYLFIEDEIIDTEFGTKSNTSDAQVHMTEEMYAVRQLEAGKYKNDIEFSALTKLAARLDDPSIELTPEERRALDLNSTKTVSENMEDYFKKSDNIITKEEAEENPDLGRIYNLLNSNKIMYLVPLSSQKRKPFPALPADFFKSDNELDSSLIRTGNLRFERDQVINRSKSRVGQVNESVMAKQVHDLIGSVITKDRSLVDNLNQANADQKAAYEAVVNAFLDPQNREALRALLHMNAQKGNRGAQILGFLDPSLAKPFNLSLGNIKTYVENALVNVHNDGPLKSKVVGGVATLISGTHYINPQTGQPLRIHRNVNGKIEYAEVLASRKFFGLNKYKTIEEVPDERLLQAFGTRIPSQTYHSMIPIKVVGFLPDSKGDSIVTPRELPGLAGSDYDLDKLYLHRYASHEGKVIEDPNDLVEYKRFWSQTPFVKLMMSTYKLDLPEAMKRLNLIDEDGSAAVAHPRVEQNKMLDNMLQVFNDPEVQEVMFIPASEGEADSFLEKYPNLDKLKPIHTVVGVLDYHTQNKLGATNVGIAANLNTLVSFMTQFAPDTSTVGININDEYFGSFGRIVDPTGKNKFDSISTLITWFVDNVKLGVAPRLNLDPDMSQTFGHLVGMAVSQMEALMLVNQPILRLYNELKESDTKLNVAKSRQEAAKRRGEIRQMLVQKIRAVSNNKGAPFTTESLDSGLTYETDIKTLLNLGLPNQVLKLELNEEDNVFLGTQLKALEFVDEVVRKYETEYGDMIQFMTTTRGLKGIDALRNMKISDPLLVHPVFQNNARIIKNMTQSIGSMLLTNSEVADAFISVYGKTTPKEMQEVLARIQQLKADPKFRSNIALHNLLRIERDENGKLTLLADSFTEMSPEIEGEMLGMFEDLFEDNPGLADQLLKYLFGTSVLEYKANSFVKYLPPSIFRKWSDALDSYERTPQRRKVADNEYKKLKRKAKVYAGETEEGLEMTVPTDREQLEDGIYTIDKMSEELDVDDGFKNLLDKLQKQGVQVEYTRGGANYYSNNKIYLGKLDQNTFLEEAIHAGLDILPKDQKNKLRKDVLSWYKQLIKDHAGKNEIQTIQRIFNRYNNFYKNEEKAAEEIVTHLLYNEYGIAQDLNNLRSPDAQEGGILKRMWNKFIQILSKYLGIEVKEGSELEKLSSLMQPVNRLLQDSEVEYSNERSSDQLFSMPHGKLFDNLTIKGVTPDTMAKINTEGSGTVIMFDGLKMPIEQSIVNLSRGGKYGAKVYIKKKVPIRNFAVLNRVTKEKYAKDLGFDNFADLKKKAKGRLLEFVNGRREGMILQVEQFLPKELEELIKMNSVDPYHNVVNNILIKLYKQLKDLQQVKNIEFATNRSNRIKKIINQIEQTRDLFTSVADFHDDVMTQSKLFDDFLETIPKILEKGPKGLQEVINVLFRMQTLYQDMSFLEELPDVFVEKIKDPNYKPPNDVLKKLQEAAQTLDLMKQKTRRQFIPIVAEKLFPFIERSGPATKAYVDQRLKITADQIETVRNSDLTPEKKNKKIIELNKEFNRLTRLAEQAPQSVQQYKDFFMYTTHDDSFINYLLTSPATSGDPGVAALVNYTNALYNDIRMQALEIANELERAEELVIQGLEEAGTPPQKTKGVYNPKTLYDALIQRVSHNGRDVMQLVTQYDSERFERELKEQEEKLIKTQEDFLRFKAQLEKRRKKTLETYKKKLDSFNRLDDELKTAVIQQQISELEASISRVQTQIQQGATEKEVIRFATRTWRAVNTVPKDVREIQAIIKRLPPAEVRSWASNQMNYAAMYYHNIISADEYTLLQDIDKASGIKPTQDRAYFGYQVTIPKFINPKWRKLYKRVKRKGPDGQTIEVEVPKNKLGQAHEIFTRIYKDALATTGVQQTVNMQLPSLRRGTLDRILDYGVWSEIKEQASRLFTIDEDDAFVYGSAVIEGQSSRRAPVYFTQEIDADDVSLDIKSSLMIFANAAARTEANNEVLKTAYLLEDIYKRERVADPEESSSIGLAKIGRKIMNFRPGQSNSEKRIEKFIEMVLLGQTKKSDQVEIFGKTLQFDKVVDGLLGYTAITTLGLDFLKGTRNALTAFWQQAIESGANRANKDRLSTNDFIAGHRIMRQGWYELYKDKYERLGNRSKLGQLLIKFDAIQGNFEDFVGKQLVGRQALRAFISTDSFLLNYHVGEVQMQGAAAIGLMLKKKIKLGNNEYNLYNAFFVNKENKLEYVEGTPEQKKEADKIVRDTINEIREMNRRLNGNYRSMDRPPAEQSSIGRAAMLFRKFLVPIAMNRWRADFVNHESGRPDGGFYRRFFRDFINNLKTSVEKNAFSKIMDAGKRATATKEDRELAFKLLHEVITLNILGFLGFMLTQALDDDDEDFINYPAYLALYLIKTTYAEIQAFSPFIGPLPINFSGMFREGLRVVRSPSAMTTGIDRFIKLNAQMFDPFEEYQRDAGQYKKGDSKLKARFLEVLGYSSGLQFNPDAALDNFLAANKRL